MHPYQYTESLASERMLTRRLTLDDVPAWTEFFEDPEAIRFFLSFLDPVSPAERARIWIVRQLARYAGQRYGLHALIEKETGQFLGQCGLLAQDIDGIAEVEVGYSLIKRHWGRGFAPEAARLFLDYAFTNLSVAYVISIIDRENINSQRVAEKNGLYRWKEAHWSGMDVYVYRMDRAQWEANR
jgi:RimJ/RimL family protein N-acetyltransferase